MGRTDEGHDVVLTFHDVNPEHLRSVLAPPRRQLEHARLRGTEHRLERLSPEH
jgi:hypothetical protein